MEQLVKKLYDKVKPIILSLYEKDIYGILFFVYANGAYTYKEFTNITEIEFGYNTVSNLGEDNNKWCIMDWNYPTDLVTDSETLDFIFDWYEKKGLKNIGDEDMSWDVAYDHGVYIGKGPVGYIELLTAMSNVAKQLQNEMVIKKHFGRNIPIIITDLEATYYTEEATKNGNPNGEAEEALKAYPNW